MRNYRNHLRPIFSRTAGRIVDADLARPFLPDKGQSSLDYIQGERKLTLLGLYIIIIYLNVTIRDG